MWCICIDVHARYFPCRCVPLSKSKLTAFLCSNPSLRLFLAPNFHAIRGNRPWWMVHHWSEMQSFCLFFLSISTVLRIIIKINKKWPKIKSNTTYKHAASTTMAVRFKMYIFFMDSSSFGISVKAHGWPWNRSLSYSFLILFHGSGLLEAIDLQHPRYLML